MAGEPIITVIGNLTADPDLRYVGSGTPVANFTVASTPSTRNTETGQWEDGEPLFIRCTVWRDYAENVAETLTKGMRVVVHGRLRVRSYEHNGERRTSIEMQVDEVGPSLRYATAQVTKTNRNSNSNGNYGGGSNFGGNISYDSPGGSGGNDRWGQSGGADGNYQDSPPF